MLVTNILLGLIIVVLFAILDRLSDIFYAETEEDTINATVMTPDELKEFIDKLNDRED